MATPLKEKEYIEKSLYEAKIHCTDPWVINYATPLPGTSLTLHQVFMVVGGVLGIINILISVYLITGHLFSWTRPREQKQCVRIILFAVVLTLTTFFSLWHYNSSGYIIPIGQFYEGFAIMSMYLFFSEVIVSRHPGLHFYSLGHVKQTIMVSDMRYSQGGKSMRWLRRTWIMVFQVGIVRVATVVASEVLFAEKCPLSSSIRYGQMAINFVQSVSTGAAVMGCIGIERRVGKTLLQGHRPLFKLFSFKMAVLLGAFQDILFPILASQKVFFPTYPYHTSYNDFAKGVPNLLFIIELFLVASMFLWSFSFKPYRAEIKNGRPKAQGPLYALGYILFAFDYIRAMVSGVQKARTVDVSKMDQPAPPRQVNGKTV